MSDNEQVGSAWSLIKENKASGIDVGGGRFHT